VGATAICDIPRFSIGSRPQNGKTHGENRTLPAPSFTNGTIARNESICFGQDSYSSSKVTAL
jgi:hypothetical protein